MKIVNQMKFYLNERLITTDAIKPKRNSVNLTSRGPNRGFISLPCQKSYILLLVEPYILRLDIGARPPLMYKAKAKSIP